MVRDDILREISEVTATRREHERLEEKKLKLQIITSTSVRIAIVLPSGSRHLCYKRDLTKTRRRRQQERQKTKVLMSKTTTLHVHHAFLYISLPSLRNYDVKCPNIKFTWEREREGDKFYHLCPNLASSPLISSSINSLSFT